MSNPHTVGWTPEGWHDYLEGIADEVVARREAVRRAASRPLAAQERAIDQALARTLRRWRRRGIYTGPEE